MRKTDIPSGNNLVSGDCIVATATQRSAMSIGIEDAGKIIVQNDTKRMYLATMASGAKDMTENHVAEHAAIGNPVVAVGVPFTLFAGNGSSEGIQWAGLRGTFTLSVAPYNSHYYSQITGGYCYLPANFGGITIAAGWYFYKMTSDTAGEVFKNTYTSGIPAIPSAPVAFGDSELTTGRLTQTTAEVTAITIASGFKANSMGPNGLFQSLLRIGGITGNSGKYVRVKIGSAYLQGVMVYGTNLLTGEVLISTRNQGVLNSQSNGRALTNAGNNGVGAMSNLDAAGSRSTIDTSVTADINVTMQLTANTDALLLYGIHSSIIYGA